MHIYKLKESPAGFETEDAIAIRPDAVQSMEEIELAYHLAQEAFRKKRNIAKKLRYEFLLWLSGTRDIKNAMRRTKPGKEFLLIVFSEESIEALGGKEAKLKRKGEPLALERISLSRI